MFRSFFTAVTAVIILVSQVQALSDADAQALLEEVRALRSRIEEQDRRIRDLESKGGPVSAEAPAARDAAPSPDEIGGSELPPSTAITAQTAPWVGGAQGVQTQIGVLLDAAYIAGRRSADDAQLREIELNMGAAVDPYFDLFVQAAFTPDEVELEQGYVTTKLPWNFQGRMGLERLQFGGFNPIDQDAFPQVDRPFVLGNFFGPEGISGIGGHLEWLAPIANPSLTFTLGAYNRARGEANTTASDKDGDGNPDSPDNFLDDGVFRVRDRERGPLWLSRISSFIGWSEDRHALRLGASYLEDKNDATGATATSVSGLDAKYRWSPGATGRGITVGGEYLSHTREEQPTTLLQLHGGTDVTARGGFAYGQYDFNRRWGLGYRYDNSNSAFSSTNEIEAHSIYGEWRPTEFSRLRAQWQGVKRNFDNNANGLVDDNDSLVMLQFTHSIGWHPAHRF